MRSHLRPWIVPVVVVAVVVIGSGLIGCTEDGVDARNVVQVYSVNDNLPLLSDVYNYGANSDTSASNDDFVPVDIVEVTFTSRVHDTSLQTVKPGGPFGSVAFTSYDVRYGDGSNPAGADLDGDGTVDLANFSAPMNAVVPTGGAAQGYILLVSGGDKIVAPISCLGPLAGAGCASVTTVEFGVNALVTFHGTEETSGDDVTLERGVLIRISQFGDN